MNTVAAFATQFVCRTLVCLLLVNYINRSLYPILVDLCGTEPRARFWSAFSALLLIGLPAVAALGYHPADAALSASFFDITRQMSRNLLSFLAALVVLGLAVSFFALLAPKRPAEATS